MASSYSAAPVSAVQVGSYFVGQYYKIIQQQPDMAFQFYVDASTIVRVDGDSSQTASTLMDIHNLITSMNFTSIEIKTLNSLESWSGGILVMVSGSVKAKGFSGRRNFVQTFFLAPQDKGYFVLTDIFQYIEDAAVYGHQFPVSSENNFDVQRYASNSPLEPPVTHYALEEEAREYVSAVSIEDNPVDKYSLPEQQQEVENEVVVEEAPTDTYASLVGVVEEAPANEYASMLSVVDASHDPPTAEIEDSWEEPEKKTYASILQVARGQSGPPSAPQPSFINRSSNASNSIHTQSTAQLSNSGTSYAPESGTEPLDGGSSMVDEGEPRSVYVRNLPFSITPGEIEQEFKMFGRIKPDGIFIRQQKDVASPYVYAFVEFEDLASVHEAIKASPIPLAGAQVYIEERRPNRFSNSRGGRRGRGRGNYGTESTRGRVGGWGLSRGATYEAGEYGSFRGNGVQQRSYR